MTIWYCICGNRTFSTSSDMVTCARITNGKICNRVMSTIKPTGV